MNQRPRSSKKRVQEGLRSPRGHVVVAASPKYRVVLAAADARHLPKKKKKLVAGQRRGGEFLWGVWSPVRDVVWQLTSAASPPYFFALFRLLPHRGHGDVALKGRVVQSLEKRVRACLTTNSHRGDRR